MGQAEAEARQGARQALQGGHSLLPLGQGLGVLAGQQGEELLHQLPTDALQLPARPLLLLPQEHGQGGGEAVHPQGGR